MEVVGPVLVHRDEEEGEGAEGQSQQSGVESPERQDGVRERKAGANKEAQRGTEEVTSRE